MKKYAIAKNTEEWAKENSLENIMANVDIVTFLKKEILIQLKKVNISQESLAVY